MKKIINDPNNVVEEMLHGLAKANPAVIHSEGLGVISRKEKTAKVGIVSGGGSGHEPAHAGYVGKGMLDAAVAGNVFSSPDPERIQEGIRQANGGKGVLLVIKNYSGDNMNFSMAAELAEMEDDIEVDSVVVKDDVAVEDSTFSTGRRGIAGTVFVHKVAGAKAEAGASLPEVKAAAEKAIKNLRSMGMSMSVRSMAAKLFFSARARADASPPRRPSSRACSVVRTGLSPRVSALTAAPVLRRPPRPDHSRRRPRGTDTAPDASCAGPDPCLRGSTRYRRHS